VLSYIYTNTHIDDRQTSQHHH